MRPNAFRGWRSIRIIDTGFGVVSVVEYDDVVDKPVDVRIVIKPRKGPIEGFVHII